MGSQQTLEGLAGPFLDLCRYQHAWGRGWTPSRGAL